MLTFEAFISVQRLKHDHDLFVLKERLLKELIFVKLYVVVLH